MIESVRIDIGEKYGIPCGHRIFTLFGVLSLLIFCFVRAFRREVIRPLLTRHRR